LHEGLSLYTVERPWLDNKAFVSCIPDGNYRIKRVDSPRFGKNMWEVAEVPNRTHILLHAANYPHNVKGCIGLGKGVYTDMSGVTSSKKAITDFYNATEGLTEMDLIIRTGVAHA
tara:strand:+ start:207 stop:551 length:345 start_codon:yes stop_codon:yes gene_type:complete